MWKITKNIDEMKHFSTPHGVQCFDITMVTDNERVARYFKKYAVHSGRTPMFTVEEITEPDQQ